MPVCLNLKKTSFKKNKFWKAKVCDQDAKKKKNVLSKLDTRLDATETGKAAEERSSSV